MTDIINNNDSVGVSLYSFCTSVSYFLFFLEFTRENRNR